MVFLFAIGGFCLFTSYASAIDWGTGDMAAFASNANPYYALGHALSAAAAPSWPASWASTSSLWCCRCRTWRAISPPYWLVPNLAMWKA